MSDDSNKVNQLKASKIEEQVIATDQRPNGPRLLDAPLMQMDLEGLRKQLKQEQAWLTGDRSAMPLLKSSSLRVVLMGLHAGAELKTHTAPGSITVQVLEGHITFHTKQQVVELAKGRMLALHAGIPHSVVAHEDTIFLLTIAL
ncbi:MAG: hypothetical protein JWR44_2704 [Hymenobacter sp.]|jgi:quercetin dioxygenase-like cupin family protein|nr:hypothetical protein [Hymenobacter sp.]